MNLILEGGFRVILLVIALFSISLPQQVAAQEEIKGSGFSIALSELKTRSLSKRAKAIINFSKINHPRTMIILEALLEGELFEKRANGAIVIGQDNDEGIELFNAETGSSLGISDSSTVKKIKLSNRLRSSLRVLIARQQLNSTESEVRLKAVKAMSKKPNQEVIQLFRELLEKESTQNVQQALQLAIALEDLKNSDKTIRLVAIQSLETQTSYEAVNRLQALIEADSDGNFLEPELELRKSIKSALVKIEFRLHNYEIAETVFFGLSLGAVLALTAIGLAITFGVMGVINMAHGEMMMLGAYTTYVMQQIMPNHIGLSIILAIPAAFMVSGIVGIGIERGIIRFLYGRPLETLLATFGVSLVLQQTVRTIFSPLNRSVITPEWMSGSWQINEFLSLTWNRLYILVFCILVFAVLLQILKRTRLGLEVRAVSQNRNMAKAMGIPTSRVDAMTFGLGSGIAGVAGVALSQITNVGPNLGQAYIVDSFMVVVFGGVGNLWGTLVAGFSLGIANKVLEPYAGAVLAKILVLVFIILFIQKRPRGLFPQKGRAAES